MNPTAEPDLSTLARSRWERICLKIAVQYATNRGTWWVVALGWTGFMLVTGVGMSRSFAPFAAGCWLAVVFSEVLNGLLTIIKRQQSPASMAPDASPAPSVQAARDSALPGLP